MIKKQKSSYTPGGDRTYGAIAPGESYAHALSRVKKQTRPTIKKKK